MIEADAIHHAGILTIEPGDVFSATSKPENEDYVFISPFGGSLDRIKQNGQWWYVLVIMSTDYSWFRAPLYVNGILVP